MQISESDLAWLVGILEGEGSFHASLVGHPGRYKIRPRIELQMADKDIVNRAQRLLGGALRGYQPNKRTKDGAPVKFMWRTSRTGRPAAEWMQQLFPHMGVRRQEQIGLALEKGGYGMRPRYRVRLDVVIDLEVLAASASGAIEGAKQIGREMVEAKGFKYVDSLAVDLERVYPPESCYEAREAMAATASQEGTAA